MCLAAMDIDLPLNALIPSEKWLNLKLGTSEVQTRLNIAGMSDLSQLQMAIKDSFSKSLSDVDYPFIQLFDEQGNSIHTLDLFRNLPGNYFEEKGPSLLIRVAASSNRIISDLCVAPLPVKRSKSDEIFFSSQNINLNKPADCAKYVVYLFEKKVDVTRLPNGAAFKDNCLEYRLDCRYTSYIPDNADNVKLLIAVSGAGKTRTMLEILYKNFGYYFTSDSSQGDFGSKDMRRCHTLCDIYKDRAEHFIQLLYFVRVVICNHLKNLGFSEPSQLLLAQLHPIAFFGEDVFLSIFNLLFMDPDFSPHLHFLTDVHVSSLTVIDEIQKTVKSEEVHRLDGSSNDRPFFSPLVRFSKELICCTTFLLTGTGINFELFKNLMESSTMKLDQKRSYQIDSPFAPLSKSEVVKYAKNFLEGHRVDQMDMILETISNFTLCHGRPRFIAYILERYIKERDIELVIGGFVENISNVNSQLFPLRFFKDDFNTNKNPLTRIIAVDTLERLITDGLLDFIISGRLHLNLSNNEAAAAILYGFGFAQVDHGTITGVTINEVAIVECLRPFIPFANLVQTLSHRIATCQKPQMVGYLFEYLVAFALVSNYATIKDRDAIQISQNNIQSYLRYSESNEVYFPDHHCGPDIIYKCSLRKTVYIVQIKFVKEISKQEFVNATATTDPELFYLNRKTQSVLKGYEMRKLGVKENLDALFNNGYTLKRMLVIHTSGIRNFNTEGIELVTEQTCPEFFSNIGNGIWGFLNSVRNNL